MSDFVSLIVELQKTPVPGLLVTLGGLFLFLALVPKIGTVIDVPSESRKWLAIVGILLLLLGIGIYSVRPSDAGDVIVPTDSTSQDFLLGKPANSKFSFEDGSMGWKAQTYKDSKACMQVLWSDEAAYDGKYSLKCMMELIAGDDSNSKGEAWVDMSNKSPVNLANRILVVWVFAPSGSSGDTDHPNGFQVFVKDNEWRSEYGTWDNVTEGQWVPISLAVSASEPEDGYMDPGFDPSKIIAIGIKMGAGDGSTAKFSGVIYIDGVDW